MRTRVRPTTAAWVLAALVLAILLWLVHYRITTLALPVATVIALAVAGLALASHRAVEEYKEQTTSRVKELEDAHDDLTGRLYGVERTAAAADNAQVTALQTSTNALIERLEVLEGKDSAREERLKELSDDFELLGKSLEAVKESLVEARAVAVSLRDILRPAVIQQALPAAAAMEEVPPAAPASSEVAGDPPAEGPLSLDKEVESLPPAPLTATPSHRWAPRARGGRNNN